MTDDQADQRDELASEVTPELRAIEWELREVIRRIEMLAEQIRDLIDRDSAPHG